MSNISTKEDVIILALQNQLTYVDEDKIITYASEAIDALDSHAAQLPLILVQYTGKLATIDSENESVNSKWKDFLFNVHCINKNLRGSKAAQREQHGLYDMIDDVEIALDGNRLALDACLDIDVLDDAFSGFADTKESILVYTVRLSWTFLVAI